MDTMPSQITRLTIVYSAVYAGLDQRKHQSSTSLAFLQGVHRGPVNSPHKWPVTRKMFPFDDIIMLFLLCCELYCNFQWILVSYLLISVQFTSLARYDCPNVSEITLKDMG